MKFRKFNEWFAKTFGFKWLPCPICEQYYGVHERRLNNCIFYSDGSGSYVCSDCKSKAKKISKHNLENDIESDKYKYRAIDILSRKETK